MEQLKEMRDEYENIVNSNDTLNRKLGISLQREMEYKHEIKMLKN